LNLIVIAKAPTSGASKTRLCPPCSPAQAASLAEAALADTLEVVARAAIGVGGRPVLVLDGEPGVWLPREFDVVGQRGDGFDERLACAFDDVGAPAFLVGMDTPQITPGLIAGALGLMSGTAVDAVLGEAVDGGWWAIGLHEADERVFLGVQMSVASTCAEQRARMLALGLSVAELPVLRDVDVFEDAVAVAAQAPSTRFAAALDGLTLTGVEMRRGG